MAVSTDPIAAFLTEIRNSARAGKANVTLPGSRLTLRIADILRREGFIENYKALEEGPKKLIRIHLKYGVGKQPAIQSLVRVSKPGRKHYVGCKEIPRVLGGLGVAILSTSKGVLTDREARAQRIGGELLCKVW